MEENLNQTLEEYLEQFPLDEVDASLSEILKQPPDNSISFSELVSSLLHGEGIESLKEWGSHLLEIVTGQVEWNRQLLLTLITVALCCGVFTNFTKVFSKTKIAETGFFVSYLLLFSGSSMLFREAFLIAGTVLEQMVTFMKMLLPSFYLAVSFETGADTSLLMSQITLFFLTGMNGLLTTIFLPMIQFYFLLMMGSGLSATGRITKLVELLEQVIRWGLKTMMGAIVGFQFLEHMILPAAGVLKQSFLLKGTSVLPGIGATWQSVTQMMLGAGRLIRNSIGGAGIFLLLLIAIVPSVILLFYSFFLKCAGALMEPVSEKRVVYCMEGTGKAVGMLLFCVFICFFTMFFTVAVCAVSLQGS